jgi:hypothetical protein
VNDVIRNTYSIYICLVGQSWFMVLIISYCFWCDHFGKVTGDQIAAVTTNWNFLKPDQKKVLQAQISARNEEVAWITYTVRLLFQIRFLTGVHGYEFVRGLGYPLPLYIAI